MSKNLQPPSYCDATSPQNTPTDHTGLPRYDANRPPNYFHRWARCDECDQIHEPLVDQRPSFIFKPSLARLRAEDITIFQNMVKATEPIYALACLVNDVDPDDPPSAEELAKELEPIRKLWNRIRTLPIVQRHNVEGHISYWESLVVGSFPPNSLPPQAKHNQQYFSLLISKWNKYIQEGVDELRLYMETGGCTRLGIAWPMPMELRGSQAALHTKFIEVEPADYFGTMDDRYLAGNAAILRTPQLYSDQDFDPYASPGSVGDYIRRTGFDDDQPVSPLTLNPVNQNVEEQSIEPRLRAQPRRRPAREVSLAEYFRNYTRDFDALGLPVDPDRSAFPLPLMNPNEFNGRSPSLENEAPTSPIAIEQEDLSPLPSPTLSLPSPPRSVPPGPTLHPISPLSLIQNRVTDNDEDAGTYAVGEDGDEEDENMLLDEEPDWSVVASPTDSDFIPVEDEFNHRHFESNEAEEVVIERRRSIEFERRPPPLQLRNLPSARSPTVYHDSEDDSDDDSDDGLDYLFFDSDEFLTDRELERIYGDGRPGGNRNTRLARPSTSNPRRSAIQHETSTALAPRTTTEFNGTGDAAMIPAGSYVRPARAATRGVPRYCATPTRNLFTRVPSPRVSTYRDPAARIPSTRVSGSRVHSDRVISGRVSCRRVSTNRVSTNRVFTNRVTTLPEVAFPTGLSPPVRPRFRMIGNVPEHLVDGRWVPIEPQSDEDRD